MSVSYWYEPLRLPRAMCGFVIGARLEHHWFLSSVTGFHYRNIPVLIES